MSIYGLIQCDQVLCPLRPILFWMNALPVQAMMFPLLIIMEFGWMSFET